MRREFLQAASARLFLVCSSLVTGLLSLKLYGRYFAPDVFGVIAVAMQIAGYLPTFDGGFRTVTNRLLLATHEDSKRNQIATYAQTIYSWLLAAAFLAISVLMLGYTEFANLKSDEHWSSWLFLSLGAAASLSLFATSQAGLLLGLGRQATMSIISGLSAPAGLLALFFALREGAGPWAFPISLLASAITTYALSVFALSRERVRIPAFRFSLDAGIRDFVRNNRHDAWKTFRSQLAILLLFTLDLVIVGIFCPPAMVAIYGVLSRVFSIGRGFLQSFSEATWPLIARGQTGVDRFQDWTLKTNAWLYGAAGGFALVGSPIFIAWYMGPEWKPSETLCWLFTLRFLVIGASSPAAYYLLGVGDFGSIAKCCEREIFMAVLLGLAVGYFLGANGVAAAFLLATPAGSFLPIWIYYTRKRAHSLSKILVSTWLRLAASFIVFALIAFAASQGWR